MRRMARLILWVVCIAGCSDTDDGDVPRSDGGEAAESDAGGANAAASDSGTTTDPCPSGVLEGDYVIQSEDDAAAIATCTEVTGDLMVTGDVESVSLPSLATVGGAFQVMDTTALTTLEIPSLAATSGGCELTGNAELTRFMAPALESTTVLGFVENAALAEVDVSELTISGFVRVQRNAALTELSVPKVEELGVFFVSENDALVSLSFDGLTTLTIDGFIVTMNPVFTTLDLPVLTDVFGDILISMNPMFPQCRADEIEQQIDDPSIPFVSNDNDESATCP